MRIRAEIVALSYMSFHKVAVPFRGVRAMCLHVGLMKS